MCPAPEPVNENSSAGKVCPDCGTPAEADYLFCQQCGRKF
ncbi:MAG: zinc-ribbon domain-containing protein [Ruminococcus sp.]|nr:zinc-ribbon domain-containing protein [Ruminococcus sp.]